MNIFTTPNRIGGRALAFLTGISMLLSFLPLQAQLVEASTSSSISATVLAEPTVDPEYFEISYTGTANLNLNGWKVKDGTSFTYVFSGVSLTDGDTYRVCQNSGSQTGCDSNTGSASAVWNNGGDSFTLEDDKGSIILTFTFGNVAEDEEASGSTAIFEVLGTTGGDKIDICHATESDTNPYVFNSPNVNSFFGPEGHSEDTEDIIPPFYYDNGDGVEYFAGNNWYVENQEIWNNDCDTGNGPETSVVKICKISQNGNPLKNWNLSLTSGDLEFSGVTNKKGCAELVDVPYGTYTIDEVMPDNNRWINILNDTGVAAGAVLSGTEVVVDGDNETFTLQNRECETGTFNYGNNKCAKPPVICEDVNAINYGKEGNCEYPPEEKVCKIGDNLLKNASFETPVVVDHSGQWELFATVSDWVISSDALELWNGLYGGASDGAQNAELDANASTEITQTVTTIPGAVYELSFDFSPRPQTGLADNSVDALIDGGFLMNAQGDGSNLQANSWTTHTKNFVAAGTSTDVSFKDIGVSNTQGSLIDNTVLCLVEEPKVDPKGTLVVKKVVVGGEASADDFSFKVNDGDTQAFEADGSNSIKLEYGLYDVVEVDVPEDYVASYNNCTEVSLNSEDNEQVCTITNTYRPKLMCEPNVELIKNGGFENPVVDHDADWNIFAEGMAGLEWLVDWLNPNEGATDPASLELHAGVNGWLPSEGDQYAELDGDYGGPDDSNNGESASTKINQVIETIPGETYTLKWDFSARPDTVQSENELIVEVEGVEVDNNEAVGGVANAWTSHSYSFVATDDETEISFADDGVSNSVGTFIDNVSLMCEPETPYGSYCGDGQVNQEWEQCDAGLNGSESCTQMCTFTNQCSTLQLVKIDLDNTESASFNGKLYLGSKNNPIPAGAWFQFDVLGDDAANDIAEEVDGLAVERDQTNGLQLAFRGANEGEDLDIVSGSIQLKNLKNGVVTRYLPDALGFDGLENSGPGFVDIFDKVDMQNVNFEMWAYEGDDSVTLELDVNEKAIAECNPDNGDNDYTLTVTITGEGSGAVTSDEESGISCSTNGGDSNVCQMTYDAGTVVGLSALADQDSNFDNSWTLGAGTCVGSTSPCSVTMNSDIDLTAHFGLNNTITTSGGRSSAGKKIELTGGGSGPDGDVEGDSTSKKPTGIVAGDQVSRIPFGAPNAGAGGTSPTNVPLTTPTIWLGLVATASNKRYAR